MNEVARVDGIRNEYAGKVHLIGIRSIVETKRESEPRWFEHLMRREKKRYL